MAKSRGRKFAELISPTNGVFDAGSLPTIPASKLPTIQISKLEDSTFSVNSESASLGGNVVIDSNDVTEHTNALYFTNARADARITAAALLPLAGGTMTGNLTLGDNVNAYFGASTDLRIYHDGTNSHIINSTGELRITGSNIAIKSDSNKLYLGAADDLKIYHDGSNSYIEDAGTGSLILKGGTISVNGAYTLPTSDGSANQVLQTDGSGTLSFATVSGGGGSGSFTSDVTINSTATAASPALAIDTSTSTTFVHIQENLAGSLTSGQHIINVIGRVGSTKNSGYYGYLYSGTAGSNDNKLTMGHWASDDLITIDGAGNLDITTGGLEVGGTTVIDSSRNISNVNITKFRDHNNSPYVSPTNPNTINADYNTDDDDRDVWINYRGYQDGFTRFRDFRVGNGKGSALLALDGSSGSFDLQNGTHLKIGGTTVINSSRTVSGTRIQMLNNSNEGISISNDGSGTTTTVGHTASNNEGIFWHTNTTDYGIFRGAGTWASPNYRQLQIKWDTGIELDGGTQYGKSGVNVVNGNFKIGGTTVIDSSRNLSNIAQIRTDFHASQAAPRFDTSFYVAQSQHFYGHNDSQVMYVGESGNDVYLRGQVAIGSTGVSSGYKLDLHGATHAHNNDINYMGGLHFNSGARFLDDSGGNFTIHKAGVNTSGGFKMQNSSGANQGYFYWDGSGIGILSSDGGWAIQNTNGATTVHHAAAFNSTVTVSSTLTGSNRLNGDRIGVIGTSSTNGRGLSLYGGANDGEPTYGVHFSGRGTFGGHGALGASDWATYFTLNNQAGRGWIFRKVGGANVASIDSSGNLELNGNANAYLYRGTSNVSGTGDASYHPSGIYSTGTNWLYGTMYLNGNSINFSGGSIASCNDIVCDTNYGRGVVGVYSATRYQHVWSMGAAYRTNAAGTSYGNMYGLTYTHSNIGTGTNQSISGLSHQLQGRQNGTLTWAMGTGIWTAHNITAYSDISVKTNLERIPDALSKVCQLNGYTYDRTDYEADPETGIMPETRQAGVVAQEVEKVLPEVVSGEEGNKAVAYGNMVSLLIEAIKEQQGQIEDLKQEIQILKGVH